MTTQAPEERTPTDLAAARPPTVMHDTDFDYHLFLRTLDTEPFEARAMLRAAATVFRDQLRHVLRGHVWIAIFVAGALITFGLVGLLGCAL